MNQFISLILEPEEKLLWSGKPEIKALFIFSIFIMICFLSISILCFLYSDTLIDGFEIRTLDFSNPVNIMCLSTMLFALVTPFVMCVFYEITEYTITNKRILKKSGFIGTNVNSVYFSQIKSSFINVGIFDRLSGCGTILIDTGRVKKCKTKGEKTVYSRFLFLKRPYQVYRLVQTCLPSSITNDYSQPWYSKSMMDVYQEISPEIGKMNPII